MSKSIHRDEYRVLLQILREAREEAGMSQGQLAEALGYLQSTMSHIERGARRLDVVEFIDYCRAVDADPRVVFDELVTATDESRSEPQPPREARRRRS